MRRKRKEHIPFFLGDIESSSVINLVLIWMYFLVWQYKNDLEKSPLLLWENENFPLFHFEQCVKLFDLFHHEFPLWGRHITHWKYTVLNTMHKMDLQILFFYDSEFVCVCVLFCSHVYVCLMLAYLYLFCYPYYIICGKTTSSALFFSFMQNQEHVAQKITSWESSSHRIQPYWWQSL